MDFKNKYLKYKSKYLNLKNELLGGARITAAGIGLEWFSLMGAQNPDFIKRLPDESRLLFCSPKDDTNPMSSDSRFADDFHIHVINIMDGKLVLALVKDRAVLDPTGVHVGTSQHIPGRFRTGILFTNDPNMTGEEFQDASIGMFSEETGLSPYLLPGPTGQPIQHPNLMFINNQSCDNNKSAAKYLHSLLYSYPNSTRCTVH